MNARQQAALVSALQLPYPSFPCNVEKRPTCPKGFHAAKPPSTVLMSLWDRYPGELIGIPTGKVTGIAVLDVDRKKGGEEWYEENKARLPATRIHRTGSGGLHLVHLHKTGLKGSASKIAPGIDVRASGGYCIWWPAEGLDVRDAPLAEWPDWLDWLIADPEERAPRVKGARDPFAEAGLDITLRGIINRVENAIEGERNAITFWAACRAAELIAKYPGLLEDGWARDAIACAAQNVGLPAFEAERTIQSAFGRVVQ
jgi:hypothetical protein